MRTELKACRRNGSLLALSAACACGAGRVDGTGDGSASTSTVTDESSSSGPDECWRVIDGSLVVDDTTDLEALRNIREIRGDLAIDLDSSTQSDLSFLGCLESVEYLSLRVGGNFVSTAGAVRLARATTIHIAPGSVGPRALEGFEHISELISLEIDDSSALERIELPGLERLSWIRIGNCLTNLPQNNPSLTSTGTFASLEHVGSILVEGNVALVRDGILDALLKNGGAAPEYVSYIINGQLPEEEIVPVFEALDPGGGLNMCGNLGGEPCECAPPG